MIDRARHRLHVWQWRLRYWYLDADAGREARLGGAVVAALVALVCLVMLCIDVLSPPPPPGTPQQAVAWWVQLIILLISAAISYALRPDVEAPKPQEGAGPTTKDGQAVIRYWGTHWVEDQFLLAWKVVGREPIKGDTGK